MKVGRKQDTHLLEGYSSPGKTIASEFKTRKVVQIPRRDLTIPETLGGIKNVYLGLNGELTDDVEMPMGGESAVIDAHGEQFKFYPPWNEETQNIRTQMAQRGYMLKDYRHYPTLERQEQHQLVRYNDAGEQVVVTLMRPNPMYVQQHASGGRGMMNI